MWEYGIYNRVTDEEDVIFGYDFLNACIRRGINPDEWEIIYRDYAD